MNSIVLRRSQASLLDRLVHVRHGADALRAVARRFAAWFKARNAAAATRRDLSAMSDHELADIGLRRWDIDAVARGQSPRSE